MPLSRFILVFSLFLAGFVTADDLLCSSATYQSACESLRPSTTASWSAWWKPSIWASWNGDQLLLAQNSSGRVGHAVYRKLLIPRSAGDQITITGQLYLDNWCFPSHSPANHNLGFAAVDTALWAGPSAVGGAYSSWLDARMATFQGEAFRVAFSDCYYNVVQGGQTFTHTAWNITTKDWATFSISASFQAGALVVATSLTDSVGRKFSDSVSITPSGLNSKLALVVWGENQNHGPGSQFVRNLNVTTSSSLQTKDVPACRWCPDAAECLPDTEKCRGLAGTSCADIKDSGKCGEAKNSWASLWESMGTASFSYSTGEGPAMDLTVPEVTDQFGMLKYKSTIAPFSNSYSIAFELNMNGTRDAIKLQLQDSDVWSTKFPSEYDISVAFALAPGAGWTPGITITGPFPHFQRRTANMTLLQGTWVPVVVSFTPGSATTLVTVRYNGHEYFTSFNVAKVKGPKKVWPSSMVMTIVGATRFTEGSFKVRSIAVTPEVNSLGNLCKWCSSGINVCRGTQAVCPTCGSVAPNLTVQTAGGWVNQQGKVKLTGMDIAQDVTVSVTVGSNTQGPTSATTVSYSPANPHAYGIWDGPAWTLSTTDAALEITGAGTSICGGGEVAAPAVTAHMDYTAPSTPSVTITGSTGRQMSMSWSATDAQSGIGSYEVEVQKNGGAWTSVEEGLEGGVSSYVFTGAGGNTYKFRVRATDAVGNVGGWGVSGESYVKSGAVRAGVTVLALLLLVLAHLA